MNDRLKIPPEKDEDDHLTHVSSKLCLKSRPSNSKSLKGEKDTPAKFNMEPENDGFNKESPFPGVDFQVLC